MEDYKEFYRFAKHFPAGLTRLFENGRGPAAAAANAKSSNKDKSGSQKKKHAGAANATTTAAPVSEISGPSVNELRERLHNKIQESKKGKHAGKEGAVAHKNPEKVKKGISKDKDRKQKQHQNNKPAKPAAKSADSSAATAPVAASAGKPQQVAAAQKSNDQAKKQFQQKKQHQNGHKPNKVDAKIKKNPAQKQRAGFEGKRNEKFKHK